MIRSLIPLFASLAVALVASTALADERLTWDDLIGRLTDVERLAQLPPPGERNAMWSSYDRRSHYDEDAGRYVEWGANKDGDGFIRREGEGVVMAEMKGPGCIWRVWSAHVLDGNVRIYIDGNPEPVVDMPYGHYFDGEHAPFDFPSLSYQTPIVDDGFAAKKNFGGGRNLYVPIPYQKSCKVVADPNYGKYFQITYWTFPEGTQVPSFTGKLPPEARQKLREVDTFLRERIGERPIKAAESETVDRKTVSAPAGETAQIAELSGPGAISAIRCRINLADRNDAIAALRQLVLRIRWDGADEPAVWCPLGDFFGTSVGVNPYRSLVTGMTDDGFYAYWYMPFAKGAVLELVNDGPTGRVVEFEIAHAPLDHPFEGLGHFHCKWHRDVMPVGEDRWPDWTVLKTTGRGRFVGMMLDVWHPRGGGGGGPKSVAREGWYWWGEGDEKFHVDGEKMPSTFGTGTEDYFGYAWCDPALFVRPFHGQPLSENNAGHQSMYRWQIADDVPFQKSFEAYMEKYFPNEWPTRFAVTACWYLSPDGEDPHGPTPVEERLGFYERPSIAGGGYEVRGNPVGTVQTQSMKSFKDGRWHNDDQLWWLGAKPGNKLEIVVPVEKAGRYAISAVLTRAPNYGIVQLSWDGKPIGLPVDLYSPTVAPSPPIPMWVYDLEAGAYVLEVTIVGANEMAGKGYLFGLDRIILEPLP